MSTAADRRRAAAVRGADAKRESAPDDYWDDDDALRKAARVRAREGMSNPGYYEVLLELAASDHEVRLKIHHLNFLVEQSADYPLGSDRFIAGAARDLMSSILAVAAQHEYEELER